MKKINDIIGNAKTVGIAGHIRPDGDCVGSCMALYNYLQKNRPDLTVKVYLEYVDKKFLLIDNTDDIDVNGYDGTVYDLFISLDTASMDRLGQNLPFFENAKRLKSEIDDIKQITDVIPYNEKLVKTSKTNIAR